MKERILFWFYFIYILVLNSYLYYLLYNNFMDYALEYNSFNDIIFVLLYIIIIIPISAYLSDKLTNFSLNMGLREGNHLTIFIVIMISLPVVLFSAYLNSESREQSLDHIITYNTKDFNYLIIDLNHDKLQIDEKEDAEELNNLFKKYKVKKIKKSEWDSDVSKEKGFQLTVYSRDKVEIMASIYEDRILLGSGKAYEVINGPINVDRVMEVFE